MATLIIDSQQTAITSAATTTILDAPALATTERHCKEGWMTIRNIGAADNTITLIILVTATEYEKDEQTLAAGQSWRMPFNVVLRGTTKSLRLKTSSTSEIHVDCNFTEQVA